MAQFDYDLLVLGAGSGGVGLARRAASHGARVAVCEESAYGGTCVHRGCVPKKLLVYASALRDELSLLSGYGYNSADPELDWSRLLANIHAELERLNGVYTRLLDGSSVARLEGRARLLDRHRVEVGGKTVSARYLAIAVGGRSFVPDFPGSKLALTSDDLFHLPQLPTSITLQGSGYIGLEFASIFAGLGSKVVVTFRSPLPLPGMDQGLRAFLMERMQARGVEFRVAREIRQLRSRPEGIEIVSDQGSWTSQSFVCATGRVPNTAGLGLEEAGVELGSKGEVRIDSLCRTSVENIFALGDCCGGVQLTPYAIAQGRALAERLFGEPSARFEPAHIPTAVFTQPPVGVVGLTQEQALEQYPEDVAIYQASFRPMKYTLPDKPEKVLMKVVTRRSDGRLLGFHMVGAEAPELIQVLAVCLTCGGTKADLDRTLAVHPTAAEEFVLMREPVALQ